jgi:glycosyltransferase involved in cell wall biosynthesis
MQTSGTSRLKILATVGNYLPGYKAGGQLRTMSNIADALGDEFDFRIVTSDRDAGDSAPYPGVETDRWVKVGKAEVCYVSPANRSLRRIARLLDSTPHDILYLNSFFSPVFSILPLAAMRLGLARRTPTVIAPRGEFSDGAIGIRSRKKFAYLAFYRAFLFRQPVLFHASSPLEVGEIAARIRRAHESFVAPDLAAPPATLPEFKPSDGPFRIAFISRICPKKNLAYALEILKRVTRPVAFDIYGPREDRAYWAECEALVKTLPPNVAARYCGEIGHDGVVEAFSKHDLFLFPTLGENFGHVIVESLLAGTPVLLADTTPWNDLDADGSGRVLPLGDTARWVEAIEEFAAQVPEKRLAARFAARRRGEAVCGDKNAITANRELFLRAASMDSAKARKF